MLTFLLILGGWLLTGTISIVLINRYAQPFEPFEENLMLGLLAAGPIGLLLVGFFFAVKSFSESKNSVRSTLLWPWIKLCLLTRKK